MNMPIDKNKLFNLFPEPNNTDEMSDSEIEINITETTYYKLGMFKKIVVNHINFFKSYATQMKKAEKVFDVDKIKNEAAFVIFNRAWHYLKDIDLNDADHFNDLLIHDPYEMSYCLQLTLKYFEDLDTSEGYIKCAFVHKMMQVLEEIAGKEEIS